MKKGKEWLKKEIESDGVQLEYLYENYYTDDKAIMIDDVRHLIDQLDEPELPVIPQFVAEWLRIKKENKDSLSVAMDGDWQIMPETMKVWLENEFNDELFALAWITENYAIEKPKLLTVIVKDYDKTIMSKQLPEDEVNKMMEGLER